MRTLSLALLGLTVVGLPAISRAETAAPWDACMSGTDAMVPASVPANLPGIAISGAVQVTDASLVAPDGTTVPTTLTGDDYNKILKINDTLKEGATYTVRWSDSCAGFQTKSFTTKAAVMLPKTAGLASSGELKKDLYYGKCDASGRPIMQVQQWIGWMPAPELVPFLSVISVDLVVDGSPSGIYSSPYGRYVEGRPAGAVTLACPAAAQTHSVVVRAQLPGGPTFTTPPLSITLSCPATPPTPCGTPTTPDVDAGSEPADIVPDPQKAAPASDDRVRAGCALKGSGGSARDGGLLALAMAALLMRRRVA